MANTPIEILVDAQKAIGGALSIDRQLFVSEHYLSLVEFLSSDRGRASVVLFVDAWRAHKTDT